MDSDVLTLKEASEYLKIRNPQTLARLAFANRVPGKKIGKQWRFSKLVLDKFLSTPETKKAVAVIPRRKAVNS